MRAPRNTVFAFIIAVGGASAAALGGAACSASEPLDTSIPPVRDATADVVSPVRDSGVDADATSSRADAAAEAGPQGGHCSAANGPACDLVLQNCPATDSGAPQQCEAVDLADGGTTTECDPVGGSQSIGKGSSCCFGETGDDPCLPGLTCIGGDECPDGGPPAGKCSPFCCSDDDSVCGSDQEGHAGHCSLTIVGDQGQDLYQVCSYKATCRPFGIQSCPAGYVCLVTDNSGSFYCSELYAPDGGAGDGFRQPCDAANACASGMECLDDGSGSGSVCQWVCHVPGTDVPFDAGALGSDPGQGGCPADASTCVTGDPTLFPPWLGICR